MTSVKFLSADQRRGFGFWSARIRVRGPPFDAKRTYGFHGTFILVLSVLLLLSSIADIFQYEPVHNYKLFYQCLLRTKTPNW